MKKKKGKEERRNGKRNGNGKGKWNRPVEQRVWRGSDFRVELDLRLGAARSHREEAPEAICTPDLDREGEHLARPAHWQHLHTAAEESSAL